MTSLSQHIPLFSERVQCEIFLARKHIGQNTVQPLNQSESRSSGWALVPLRLIVGFGFVAHAVAKLGRGPDKFAEILQAIGVPSPHLMAWATIATELCGGIAILLGAFVAYFSIPLAAVLTVAIVTVHLRYGFSSIRLVAVTPSGAQFGPVGYECSLLYLASLATLVAAGCSPLSIDGWLKKRRSKVPAIQR